MPTPSELDQRIDARDKMQDVNGELVGKNLATHIYYLKGRGLIRFPWKPRYLALAAGYAVAEMSMADRLKIGRSEITLVDQNYPSGTQEYLEKTFPKVHVVPAGLFSYLATTDQRGFSLVTMLGAEYVVDELENLRLFGSLVTRVIKPGGVLFVSSMLSESTTEMWSKLGFNSLDETRSEPEFLLYKEKNL